jgi:hypothetical protein
MTLNYEFSLKLIFLARMGQIILKYISQKWVLKMVGG